MVVKKHGYTEKIFAAIIIILLCFALVALVISCNPYRKCEKYLAKIQKSCPTMLSNHDSTIIKNHDTIIVHYDTIHIPQQIGTATFNLDSLDHAELLNEEKFIHQTKLFKGGSATVSIHKGVETVICHEDSAIAACKLKDSVITYMTTHLKQTVITKEVPKPLTAWESIRLKGGDLLFVLITFILGFGVFKIYKEWL